MAKRTSLLRLCLACACVLTLGGIVASVGVPLEASEESVLTPIVSSVDSEWQFSSGSSVSNGYLWADAASDLDGSLVAESDSAGYSWSSGTAGLNN